MTTLMIETLKAGDLPAEWAERLRVNPDQAVTVRIETEDEILEAPAPEASFTTDDPAFGIWRDHDETTDVSQFVRRLRASRYRCDGSRRSD